MKLILDYVPVASICVALAAFTLSCFSFWTSRRALRLSEIQEERRLPLTATYLEDGYKVSQKKPLTDFYAFLVVLSNRSDSNASIARIELTLTYTTTIGSVISTKLNSLPNSYARPTPSDRNLTTNALTLPVPTHINARQSIAGWCLFKVDGEIKSGIKSIEKYKLTFTDSFGNESELTPDVIREYRYEDIPSDKTNS